MRDFNAARNLWKVTKQYYDRQGFHTEMQKDLDYYEREFKINVGAGFPALLPSTSRQLVDIPVSHTITDKRLVHSPKIVNGRTEVGDAEKREQFALALLEHWNRCFETPMLKELAKNLYCTGMGVIEGPFYTSNLSYKPTPGSFLPIHVDSGDPLCWYFDPAPGEPKYAFKSYKRLVSDIVAKYPWWGMPKKNVDDVEWVEGYYYTDDESWRFYMADERPVAVVQGGEDIMPLGLPYLPVIRLYSGFGRRSPKAKPQQLARSIYFAVRSGLIAEAELLSQAVAFGRSAAWQRYRTNAEPEKYKNVTQPGVIIKVDPEDTLEPEPMPDIPVGLFQLLGQTRGDIQRGTFAGVVGGERPEGVDTASGLAILSGQARLRFDSPTEALERALGIVLGRVGRLVDMVIGEEVGVGYMKLDDNKEKIHLLEAKASPKIFEGIYLYYVKLLPSDPEEANTRIAVGSAELDKGHIDFETYVRDFLRREDTEGLRRRLAKDKIMNSPAMQQMIARIMGGLLIGPTPEENTGNAPSAGSVSAQLRSMAEAIRAGRFGSLQMPEMDGSMAAVGRLMGNATNGS